MPAKSIYLTFDDGPNEPYTSEILERLKKYGAQATFFVCGRNVERDPQALKNIAAAGQAIGNHGYSHSWLKILWPRLLFKEFMRTHEIIAKTIGRKTDLVRAPWGMMPKSSRWRLAAQNYRIFSWDIAPYDWWQPSAAYIARSTVRQAFDGCVVLLHDGQKTQTGKSRANTVAALDILIPALQKEGYVFKSL